ncbi:PTS system, glucose-like IIB component [Atopostipes suicloacalis DSM 15692]|uniref:PTS system, glucose-like IIB component n=1 Tax=Atopostipes suicloacalis DSM 15692 TaxID=1121025 RepID=A0A1M4YEL3_9LACT|nr:PTS glucose/sucrose transporter subunit IIB [Atopostipes suicloacalis]SHF04180.1 PTS system, glucose-like IIB component [Atopostipes suicloacalis DSM 15692]
MKTIGREDRTQDTRLYSKEDYKLKKKESTDAPLTKEISRDEEEFGVAPVIVQALGGSENINYITNCYSRLRLTVNDPSKVDEALLKNETGASGVMIKDQNVQVVYGLEVNKIRRAVDNYLGRTNEE